MASEGENRAMSLGADRGSGGRRWQHAEEDDGGSRTEPSTTANTPARKRLKPLP